MPRGPLYRCCRGDKATSGLPGTFRGGSDTGCCVNDSGCTDYRHLGARLANGRYVRGQSALTNETTPIEAPMDTLELCPTHQRPEVGPGIAAYGPTLRAIEAGRAIVYAWGSFHTSIVCCLLVPGIVTALAANPAPKVLLLNPFVDAETTGRQPRNLIGELCRYGGAGNGHGVRGLVTHVLALRRAGASTRRLYDGHHRTQLEALGIRVIEVASRGIPLEPELRVVMEHLLALSGTHGSDGVGKAAVPG